MRMLTIVASACGLALTAAGAVGAHVVGAVATAGYTPNERGWDSALLYGFVHTVAALVAAFAPLGRLRAVAAWLFIAGVVLFSFTIVGKELLGGMAGIDAGWLSKATPVGGVSFMIAWIVLGVAAATHKPSVVIGD